VAADLLEQAAHDLVVDRQLTDLALRVGELAILDRERPALQMLRPARQNASRHPLIVAAA
jgi:hypothetical protein